MKLSRGQEWQRKVETVIGRASLYCPGEPCTLRLVAIVSSEEDVLFQDHLPGEEVGPQKLRVKEIPQHSLKQTNKQKLIEHVIHTKSKVISMRGPPRWDWTCRDLLEEMPVSVKRAEKSNEEQIRKNQVGRKSDYSAVPRKLCPGQWGIFKPRSPIRGVLPVAGMGLP